METKYWIFCVVFSVVVVLLVIVWRLFSTANKTIDVAANAANEAIDVVRPIAAAVGRTIDSAGNVVQEAGNLLNALTERLKRKQFDRMSLESENVSLQAKISELKSRRVNATAVERQLQVAFFSIKTKYTSFFRDVNQLDAGGLFGMDRPTSREFISIIDATYTEKVGVDIGKLRFKINPDSNFVYIRGAREVESIGLNKIKFDRKLTESRIIFEKTNRRNKAVEVQPADEDLMKQVDHHQNSVLKEIQHNSLASSLAEANEKIAIGFFRALVGSGQYEFFPADPDEADFPFNFSQLCEKINSSIESQIRGLESSLSEVAMRAQKLDAEIIEIATQNVSISHSGS